MLKKTLKGRFAPPALSTLSQPELSSVLGGRAYSQSSRTAAAVRTVSRQGLLTRAWRRPLFLVARRTVSRHGLLLPSAQSVVKDCWRGRGDVVGVSGMGKSLVGAGPPEA